MKTSISSDRSNGGNNTARWSVAVSLIRLSASDRFSREPYAGASSREMALRVRRRLGLDRRLQPAHALAVRGVEAAADDHRGAGDGPEIRDLAEHEEAEHADPHQLSIGKRRQHRGIGVAERQHH